MTPVNARCPTPCDDDCEASCHEGHQVPVKRTHALDSCQAVDGPEWAEWVPEAERQVNARKGTPQVAR